jgi:hypothetical protein
MFDRDLILDKFNSLHHHAKNLLLRFKARVIERCADIRGTVTIFEKSYSKPSVECSKLDFIHSCRITHGVS